MKVVGPPLAKDFVRSGGRRGDKTRILKLCCRVSYKFWKIPEAFLVRIPLKDQD